MLWMNNIYKLLSMSEDTDIFMMSSILGTGIECDISEFVMVDIDVTVSGKFGLSIVLL